MHFQHLHEKKRYQIHLKSHAGPIYVLLVNKDTDSTSPVVVQVPPPRDDLYTQSVTEVEQNQNMAPIIKQERTPSKVSDDCILYMSLFEE